MTRACSAAAVLAACCAFSGSAQDLSGVERQVLPNGLVVLLLEDHRQPLVTVGTMYRVGAKHESAGATGLAHYCEHMNFRATRALPGSEITEAITRLGGRWTGYTWIDQTWYAETVPSAALEPMLDLERQRMSEALYDPEDFRKERTSVLAELRSYDDPRSLLYDAVLQTSFGVHPYRNNTIGWPADVLGVTRGEAYAFYRRYYHPDNAVLVAVGDLDPARTLEAIRARFGSLPGAGASTELRSVEPAQTGQRRVSLRQPGSHARVLLAYRAPALGEPDFPELVLFDALLGGGKGLVFDGEYAPPAGTPLERALVAPGLATRVESHFQASRDPYVFTLGADLPHGGLLAATESALFQAVADAAHREWASAELDAARLQVGRGLAQDLDELAGRAHQLAFFEVGGGYEHLLALPGRLERVTPADLHAFAAQRLRPDQATVGWFEPTATEDAGPLVVPSPTPAIRPVIPAAGSARATTPTGPPQSFTLANGLAVTLAPGVGSGLVAVRLRLEAGSAYGAVAPLLAEWLAQPATGESGSLPGISLRLHDSPGDPANTRWLELSAEGLATDLPGLLASLAARLTRPAPLAAEIATLRAAALQRAREHLADPETALAARARQTLFGDSPLGLPAWGTEGSFSVLSDSGVRSLLAGRCTPARARLVVAGQFDASTLRAALPTTLGRWPGPGPSDDATPHFAAAHGPSAWTELRLPFAGKTQDDVLVVFPGDRSQPHDHAATAVLLYLLGETGYAGRLGRALVEPGLVYWVGMTLEEEAGMPGYLAIRTAASPADTPEVLRRIRAILEQAGRGGFTQTELDEARTYLRGKALRERAATARLARRLLEGEPAEEASLVHVSLEQLNDTARRLGRTGAPLALVAGP